ncbi:hypothetical protein GCM10009096_19910 [Parasphingorhabdus litoris]|uniref:HTH tetR-type domain-containing protein n=2 Tax=Parasphingorhabdus litoris TaxID=394733 RepID=A0ABN1AJF2_9SPHN
MQILYGARHCFIDNGFDGASISQIANQAGVSVANIYQYFESKESMIHALIEYNLEIDLLKIQAMNATMYEAKALRRYMHSNFADDNHIEGVRLMQEIISEATRSDEVANLLKETERKAGIALMEGLSNAIPSGHISPTLDPLDAARKISYFHNGMIARLAITPSLREKLADQFTDFILETLNNSK